MKKEKKHKIKIDQIEVSGKLSLARVYGSKNAEKKSTCSK